MAYTLEKFDTIKQFHGGESLCLYRNTSETLAACIASGYFDDQAQILASGSLIIIIASNGFGTYRVTNTADVITLSGAITLPPLGSAAPSASGLLFGVGTSVAPATTSVADAKFIEIRAQNSATSGDNRLGYFRFDISGAGGGGECIRAFTDLTAAAGTAHGAHFSLQAGATGYITGSGIGARCQLFIKDEAVASGGTYYGAQAEIYSAGSTSSLAAVTKHAVFSIAATGNATGMATVLNALSVDGTAAADATKMISSVSLAELPSSSVAFAVLINGTRYYIPCVLASELN